MTKLSERVERLEGPDRGLFVQAFFALNPEPDMGPWWSLKFPPEYQLWDRKQQRFAKLILMEAWLSAAEMLVPEGHTWWLSVGGVSFAEVTDCTGGPTVVPLDFDATTKTPAIALLAAALKARGL